MAHIAIIGGGIAGLATAYYLQKKREVTGASLDYTLIESDTRFGGKIITRTIDDFVIEGGPDSLVTTKPWGVALCRELGLDNDLIPTNDYKRGIFVLNKGKLVEFPGGFRLTIPTEFVPFAVSPLISPLGKLRMGLDLFIHPRQETGDESLASFVRRRLGQEALDKIAGPMMAGIYMADPERMSIQSTFPQFLEMERQHGSLIKAMQRAKKNRPVNGAANGKPQPMFLSLKGGLNDLVKALVSRLEGRLCLGQRVAAIRSTNPGFEIRFDDVSQPPITADAVVLAVPAYTAAQLVESFLPPLAQLLAKIRYVSTATISLGYRRADVIDQHNFGGFGFLIPKSEKRKLAACTWTSTKFDGRAPNNDILLRAFVGGDGQEKVVKLPDNELLSLVRAEIADLMGVTAKPIICQIFRWVKGNPQYDVDHLARVEQMKEIAQQATGLYLTGSAYLGIGIPDCVKDAMLTADSIFEQLNSNA
ncbi:MAG TPA: protoporphyrinogen oxidase [Anaerolineae bacterium]|nr:protoporphyrinogen oxidase [Anaerolineae bacterium]